MNEFDPKIRAFLERFAERRRIVRLLAAICWAGCLFTSVTIITCLADRFLNLDSGVRFAILILNLACSIGIIARPLWFLTRPVNLLATAVTVENREPLFGERLQTYVSQMLSPKTMRGSETMLNSLVSQIQPIIDSGIRARFPAAIARSFAATAACGVLVLILALIPGLKFSDLLSRTFEPFADIQPATTAQITIAFSPENPMAIRAVAKNVGDAPPVVVLSVDGITWHRAAMTPTGADEYTYPLESVPRALQYYVEAGDAKSTIGVIFPQRSAR